jgi:hypothetical protein
MASVKIRKGEAVIAVSLFWLLGFTLLGWLIFKIAERM